MSKGITFSDLIAQRTQSKPTDVLDTGKDDITLARLRELTAGKNRTEALATINSNQIRTGAFLWTSTGLKVEGKITRDDWEQTGQLLHLLDQSLQWLIGDLIVHGEDLAYGDQIKIADLFGFQHSTIRDYAYVARNVELSVRTDSLDFGHHKLVAGFAPREQVEWLQRAEIGNDGKRWSVSRLRQEIKDADEDNVTTPINEKMKSHFQSEERKAFKLIDQGAQPRSLIKYYQSIIEKLERL